MIFTPAETYLSCQLGSKTRYCFFSRILVMFFRASGMDGLPGHVVRANFCLCAIATYHNWAGDGGCVSTDPERPVVKLNLHNRQSKGRVILADAGRTGG